jgi:hypothetical protein
MGSSRDLLIYEVHDFRQDLSECPFGVIDYYRMEELIKLIEEELGK